MKGSTGLTGRFAVERERAQARRRQHGMSRHIERTAGTEHQRWIADIALEQEGAERPLLGHERRRRPRAPP